MKKSTLLEVLRTFSKKELSSFGDFLLSPYHNKKNNVTKLYSYVKKFAPAFDDDALEKERVWKKLYPGKAFNYGVLKNLMFELNKLAEKFIAFYFFEGTKNYEVNLIYGLKFKELWAQANKKIKVREDELRLEKYKEENYILDMLEMMALRIEYNLDIHLHDKNKEKFRTYSLNYFLLSYFAQSLNLLIEHNRKGIEYDNKLLEVLIEHFRENPGEFLEESPIIKIYFHLVVSLMNYSDEKLLQQAYDFFKEKKGSLNNLSIRNCSSAFAAICIQPSNKEKEFFVNLNLQIKKDEVDDGSLLYDATGKMSINVYRNIIIAFVTNNETAYLIKFIKLYKNKVATGDLEHIEKYSDAMRLYSEGKYEESVSLFGSIELNKFLNTVEDNLHFKIDVKIFSLRCNYELGRYELCIYSLESFNQFIKNAKHKNPKFISNSLLFSKYLRKIIDCRISENKKEIRFIRNELLKSGYFPRKNYLVKKIEEMFAK